MIVPRKTVLIFGCGEAGRRAYALLQTDCDVVGFLDNNAQLHGTTLFDRPVRSPASLPELTYDRVFIASMYHREIWQQLVATLCVPPDRIEFAPQSETELALMLRQLPRRGRPVLIVDEYQWKWMRLPLDQVVCEGRRQGLSFSWHKVAAINQRTMVDADGSLPDPDPDVIYREVRLWPAVHYSVCVEVEAASSEIDWNDPVHRRCIARWYAVARTIVDELYTVFARTKPRAVVALQGYFVSAAVTRQLASRFGYHFFALENTFSPQRLICEPFTGIAVNRTSAALFFKQREDLLPPGKYCGWLDQFLASLDEAKVGDHASPVSRFAWPEGRKRIVFLGQCYTDSSVLFGVHDGATARSILHTVFGYLQTRPAFLLAKLHPKENGGTNPLMLPYNRLTWRKLQEDPEIAQHLLRRGPEYCWEIDEDNRFSTSALLRDCDVVLTINSQGGLEAAGHGKNVLLFGDAFYANLGFTFNVQRMALLPALLDAVLFGGVSLVDREAVARFLHVYFQDYCLERTPMAFVRGVRARLWPRGTTASVFGLPAASPKVKL